MAMGLRGVTERKEEMLMKTMQNLRLSVAGNLMGIDAERRWSRCRRWIEKARSPGAVKPLYTLSNPGTRPSHESEAVVEPQCTLDYSFLDMVIGQRRCSGQRLTAAGRDAHTSTTWLIKGGRSIDPRRGSLMGGPEEARRCPSRPSRCDCCFVALLLISFHICSDW